MSTANGVSKPRRWPLLHRRVRAGLLTGTAGVAMLAAGCGTESAPSLGTETPTTTTASTIPPETTTTIDFDRAPDQERTALPAGATAIDVARVIDDMRGPTRDLSEQVGRLITFVKLSSPVGSQIIDLAVSVTPSAELDGKVSEGEVSEGEVSAQVTFRGPQTSPELDDYFDAELRSRGWNKAADTVDETVDGTTSILQVFRIPGTAGDDTELAITINDGPVSVVDIDYHSLTVEGDDSFDRLAAWQAVIPTPRAAIPVEARVFTADDEATLAVVHSIRAVGAAEVRQEMVALAERGGFDVGPADAGTEANTPAVLTDETGQRYLLEFVTGRDPEIIELVVSASFDLEPID